MLSETVTRYISREQTSKQNEKINFLFYIPSFINIPLYLIYVLTYLFMCLLLAAYPLHLYLYILICVPYIS